MKTYTPTRIDKYRYYDRITRNNISSEDNQSYK